jgi:hypothetical protein
MAIYQRKYSNLVDRRQKFGSAQMVRACVFVCLLIVLFFGDSEKEKEKKARDGTGSCVQADPSPSVVVRS